jgi:hypothetical protein
LPLKRDRVCVFLFASLSIMTFGGLGWFDVWVLILLNFGPTI